MFSTFDSGLSRNNNFNTAVDSWKTPQISTPLHTNDPKPIKIKTPYVKEPFGDIHGDIYQQPLLSVYEPYTHDFALHSFSSLPNAPLLQKKENFDNTPSTGSSMVPFFGPRLLQDMSGTQMPNDFRSNKLSQVSMFTGINDYKFARKVDTPNYFFQPNESKEKYKLTSSGKGTESTCMMNIDLDRYAMDITKKDECFDRTQVGRSLAHNANVPASDGFQSFYRYIDEDKKRKYNYGVNMLADLKVMDVPTFPWLPKPHTSAMPQENTVSTKPRIFDGSLDLQTSRFYNPSQKDYRNESNPDITKSTESFKKTAVQADIKDKQQSELMIPLRDPLMIAPNNYVRITDNDTNDKKVSMSIPVIQGRSLSNPFNNTPNETMHTTPTDVSKEAFTNDWNNTQQRASSALSIHPLIGTITERNDRYVFPIIGKRSIVPSSVDDHFQQDRFTERLQPPPSYGPLVSKHRSNVDTSTYTNNSKKKALSGDTSDFKVYPALNSNLRPFPKKENTPKHDRYDTDTHSEVRKIVRFKQTDPEPNWFFKEKKTRRDTDQFAFETFPRHFLDTTTRMTADTTSETSDSRIIEVDRSWPKQLLPKTKENTDVSLELRKTKRNSSNNEAFLEFGIKKGQRTSGETLDVVGSKSKNLSLKKSEKIWPMIRAGSNTHIAAPLEIETNENTRTSKNITDQALNHSHHLPTRVFPNDVARVTSRRHSDMDLIYRTPNPSFSYHTNDSQRQFFQNFSSRDKSKSTSFVYDPIPKNANIATGIDTVGIQTNVRV